MRRPRGAPGSGASAGTERVIQAYTFSARTYVFYMYTQASLDWQVRGAPVGQRHVEPDAEEERKARCVYVQIYIRKYVHVRGAQTN